MFNGPSGPAINDYTMIPMKYLALLLISLPAFGQFGAASRILSGTGAPVAAQCTVENNVGLVWARKDGADAGTTFYVCGATGVGTYGWELRGGAPGGGAALSTVGSVPFVTASGVLGQSANLFWDNANGRLGVGTNAPNNPLQVVSTATSAHSIFVSAPATNSAGSGFGFASNNGANTGLLQLDNSGNLVLRQAQSSMFFDFASQLNFRTNAGVTQLMRLLSNGNLLLGTTTDGNFRLDVGSSGSSGTLRAWDQTPTTGSTSLVVRAGAGQGSNNLQTWQNSGGTAMASVRGSDGALFAPILSTFDTQTAGISTSTAGHANGVNLNSSALTAWSSTSSWFGTKDLSLSRASANTLQVGDGSANSNGTILARIYTWANGTEGTCDATLRGQVVMVQGGAGVADTFRVCRKDAANAYAWTALY